MPSVLDASLPFMLRCGYPRAFGLLALLLLSPVAHACDEALTGTNDAGYRGCQTQTRSGYTCQRWDSQTPHAHPHTPAAFPAFGLEQNYCRNPDGSATIWCYTSDPMRLWDYCDPLQTQAPPQCFETGVDYVGHGLDAVVRTAPDAAGCQALCQAEAACAFFTYEQTKAARCHLKTSKAGSTKGLFMVSGPKVCPDPFCFDIEVKPDGHPEEIGWQIVDSNYLPVPGLIARPAGFFHSAIWHIEAVCLLPGDYSFTALSSTGTGWHGGQFRFVKDGPALWGSIFPYAHTPMHFFPFKIVAEAPGVKGRCGPIWPQGDAQPPTCNGDFLGSFCDIECEPGFEGDPSAICREWGWEYFGDCEAIPPTCVDWIQNGDETAVDCGGSCGACPPCVNVLAAGDAVQGHSGTDPYDPSHSPIGEGPEMVLIPHGKYLNFLAEGTGFVVTPARGWSTVNGIAFTCANDFPNRDPHSFILYGSSGPGQPFHLIASSQIPAFRARFTRLEHHFENTRAYRVFRIIFPTIKNPSLANSMQIQRVELLSCEIPSHEETHLYTFGWGGDGRLGHCLDAFDYFSLEPKVVGQLSPAPLAAVAAGKSHTAVIYNDTVYTFGHGGYGRLGHDDDADRHCPTVIEHAPWYHVYAVAAGRAHEQGHTAVIADGQLYTFGYGCYGALGHCATDHVYRPQKVNASWSTVSAVAAGGLHTLVIADGALYAFGNNQDGQLGTGCTDDEVCPRKVGPVPWTKLVTAVAAGMLHSAVISNGKLYTFGNGQDGQLGHGDAESQYAPKLVDGPWTTVTAVAAGDYHTIMIADEQVYTWGLGQYGQLGHGDTRNQLRPRAVASVPWSLPTHIAGGAVHTAVIADERLYTFGNGPYGALGHGAAQHVLVPTRVSEDKWKSVNAIATGGRHTAVIVDVPQQV